MCLLQRKMQISIQQVHWVVIQKSFLEKEGYKNFEFYRKYVPSHLWDYSKSVFGSDQIQTGSVTFKKKWKLKKDAPTLVQHIKLLGNMLLGKLSVDQVQMCNFILM